MSGHYDTNWANLRQATFLRDQYQCRNCLGMREKGVNLDPDHNVPRGVGGSDRLGNLTTLCRRCHEAKHGDGIAPTVQLESTGEMSNVEFKWFKHFLKEMIPAMAQGYNIRLVPKFGLTGGTVWYLPLGDLRRLDQEILEADEEEQYSSLQAHQYM